jgi:hypothetical protein
MLRQVAGHQARVKVISAARTIADDEVNGLALVKSATASAAEAGRTAMLKQPAMAANARRRGDLFIFISLLVVSFRKPNSFDGWIEPPILRRSRP